MDRLSAASNESVVTVVERVQRRHLVRNEQQCLPILHCCCKV